MFYYRAEVNRTAMQRLGARLPRLKHDKYSQLEVVEDK
jgi:hypothetical protein